MSAQVVSMNARMWHQYHVAEHLHQVIQMTACPSYWGQLSRKIHITSTATTFEPAAVIFTAEVVRLDHENDGHHPCTH